MKLSHLLSLSCWVCIAPSVVACGGVSHDSQSKHPVGVVPGDDCAPLGSDADASDGCNTCSCTEQGWACTEMACNETCSDGETLQQDCNSCVCSDGQWACTDAYCGDPPGTCPAPRQPSGDIACTEAIVYAKEPDSGLCCMYNNGCAAPEGWATFGTEEACEASCEQGSSKLADDGCNTCTCTAEGWACTEIACQCQEGTTRRAEDGCNVCSCSGGDWACTEKACADDEPIGCGGWLGDTCTDDEYCAYEEGQHCGAADASATCQPRPEACTQEYAPVCGCDGQTYGNACAAAAAGTGVSSSGECN